VPSKQQVTGRILPGALNTARFGSILIDLAGRDVAGLVVTTWLTSSQCAQQRDRRDLLLGQVVPLNARDDHRKAYGARIGDQ
jgi:hypothetical protein